MLQEPPNIQPYTPNAWLLSWATNTPQPIHNLSKQLHDNPIIKEITLGYNTLLIQTNHPITKQDLETQLKNTTSPLQQLIKKTKHHQIQVTYDGPDLTETESILNLTKQEIITLHSTPTYTVRFLGFAPGFPYLDGLHPKLCIPRRTTPRTHINTGAVAIANGYTSIYTTPSPGGWNWIGNTTHPIFILEKNSTDSFTLHPGDTLQFIPS